jgi:hydroxymethylbilane synthase
VLETEVSLPAVGQGALAIELRAGDERTASLLASLADPETSIAVAAERGVMIAVQGGCQTPVAAHAVRQGDALWLRALLAEPDGSRLRRDERRVAFPANHEDAEAVGRSLGEVLVRG